MELHLVSTMRWFRRSRQWGRILTKETPWPVSSLLPKSASFWDQKTKLILELSLNCETNIKLPLPGSPLCTMNFAALLLSPQLHREDIVCAPTKINTTWLVLQAQGGLNPPSGWGMPTTAAVCCHYTAMLRASFLRAF